MNYRFCREDLISECLPSWPDEEMMTKCAAYMGAIYTRYNGYRNVHCALCNNVSASSLRCSPSSKREFEVEIFNPNAFSLLFDINTKMGEYVGEDVVCEDEERYDFLLKRCVNTVCGLPGYKYVSGECIQLSTTVLPDPSTRGQIDVSSKPTHSLVNETKIDQSSETNNTLKEWVNDTDGSLTRVFQNKTSNETSKYAQDFIHCLKVVLYKNEYTVLKNGDVFVEKYEESYNQSYYLMKGNNVLICKNEKSSISNSKETFSVYLGYISNIGLGISLICLVLHFVIFILVPDLHSICGRNLASLAVALIISYSCFIAGQFNILSRAVCTIIAIVMYYSFLASFFWMNILAFDVWRTLRMATKDLRVSSGKQWRRFVSYSFYCWIAPIIIVVLSVVFESLDGIPIEYRPAFGTSLCWFNHRRALLVFFATPVALIMLINIVFFILSAGIILASTNNTAKYQASCTSPKRNFRLYTKLYILMGLSWIFGLVAGYSGLESLWYVFVVFNTLQGMFIFFAFSCTKKVRMYFADKMSSLTKPFAYRTTSLNSGSGSGFQSQCTLNSQLAHRTSSLNHISLNHSSVH
ncbi:probable G-protein coupled receptor Mth-like 10 [Limulus polyphemus]|uniref:Probable G-protein coupled receptor Mth-like 10 n=1 Tax=Limulus polyphemus TaxID=6850 RepID=A0ABM1SWB3_LIMPO|nr:probable G-protein coupled receptor Mth-like 10 [Limulus polyphemus]